MKARVIIADDHLLFVEGLWRVLDSECEVIACCKDGCELVATATQMRPDIVLLDIAMPRLNGVEAGRQIRAQAPSVKLIYITMQLDREYVREAFELGASGYLSKQSSARELTDAIAQVQAGRFAFSPVLAKYLLGYKPGPEENPSTLFAELTPRQREVLQLVGEGKTARQISTLLTISVKTVEFHKKQLMVGLNVRNSAELIRYAVERGLTTANVPDSQRIG